MKATFLFLFPFWCTLTTIAQPYPEVGKPMPDFTMHNIAYYSKQTATLKDFKGKWLLLDFWAESCGACIAAFPDKNKIQKELGDKVQVMLVGIHGEKLRSLYELYQKKEGLTMPCAYDTSLFFKRFDFEASLPKTILIDDKGIVQAITYSVNYDDMKSFLAGGHPYLAKAYREHEKVAEDDGPMFKFDPKKPFAINYNGAADTSFLFRSVLAPWNPEFSPWERIEWGRETFAKDSRSFWVLGVPLEALYFYAYFGMTSFEMRDGKNYGEYYIHPVVEAPADTTVFVYSVKTGKNMFSYSVNSTNRKLTDTRLKNILKNDLENYFGFQASIETRKMPCWKIVATDASRERLKTKGGKAYRQGNFRTGFTAINTAFEDVLGSIRVANPFEYVFDETGITGNIDIDMRCDGCVLTDIMDVKKALEKNGLGLVQEEKEMKALVIRDNNK